MGQVERCGPGPVHCSLFVGIILGPEAPEVRGQVCLDHRFVVPCSKEPKMPAVDTDGQQVNNTRIYRFVLRTLKGRTKQSRRWRRCALFCEAESGLQAHPGGVAGWGPDHSKASRNRFAGGESHLPFVKTTPAKRGKACIYLTSAHCNA